MTGAPVHVPVLLAEVMEGLALRPGGRYVDGTFGAGGYARAILEAAPDTRVWGIDRDPAAIARGRDLAAAFPGRLVLVEGRFGDMDRIVAEAAPADGVALDLGVSSPQIETPDSVFSFRFDGPLDMRMGREGPTAADVVNAMDEGALADVIYHLGEERFARRVARAIVAARARGPITRTAELADLVRGVVPKSRDGIDPATRTFQALRIHVNDELGQLEMGLRAAERLLAPEGRLAVVSFHSLEDRIVKNFLRERGGMAPSTSRHLPEQPGRLAPSFSLTARGAVKPTDAETDANPRARSARLRAAIRSANDAWPDDGRRAA
jgi:16S rRNA (cytosine1402-N4)-methyltransferase